MYSGVIEKDHSIIITLLYKFSMHIITNKLKGTSVTKISKPVSRETFVIASKDVDKPLKVMNWHLSMH